MRRSKLGLYQEILCALKKKACTIDQLAYECDTNCLLLEQRLTFLISNSLVTIEIDRSNRAAYVLSRRGEAVTKTLTIAKQLERLQTSLNPSVKEINAVQAAPNQRPTKTNRTT